MKPTIEASEFLGDIRAGMPDPDIVEKYRLTFDEFERLLRYLIDIGMISQEQLEESQQLSKSQIIRAFVESQDDELAI